MVVWPTEKQPVHASQAVVAANHPYAAAAGISMIAAGGNVADAAVAAIFACGVVEPQMVGPLGGGYIVFRDADGSELVIDNYAEAPGRASETMYTPDPSAGFGMVVGQHNMTGHLACGVPGNLKGWLHLHQLKGSLPLAQVMQPAIDAAEHGTPVTPYLRMSIESQAKELREYPSSTAIFMPGGEILKVGTMLRNPDQAATLRAIAKEGGDYLYRGPLGDAVVRDMQANGGLITHEDLQQYEVREIPSIKGTYRGYGIIGTPPSSGGGILNQLGMNILENFDLRSFGFGTARYWHVIIETLKLMFADRNAYLGDPNFVDFPQDALLDKAYAKGRAALIKMDIPQQYEGGEPAPKMDGHTTHLTVMAADGSVVTMTQTINMGFGARAVVPGTGLLLNDNMALFDARPGRPNSIAPYKRMLTATAATILTRDGETVAALGTPGGIRIFPAVLQGILNLVDHEMTIQEAVEAPRVWCNGPVTEIESIASDKTIAELESMGHKLNVVPAVAGNMNGVQRDPATGMLLGGACWRGNGGPVGLSGGLAKTRMNW